MTRPAGDPGALAAVAQSMGGAAGALRDLGGRLLGATSFVVVAGGWQGPASEAFLADGARLRAGLDLAADALEQAAGALSELSARLEQAQLTWDRAQQLASTPHDGVRSPVEAVDPAAMLVAGQAVAMARAAEREAAAARRVAAARLDQATARLPRPSRPAGRVGEAAAGHGDGGKRHGGVVERAVGRVLEAGAEVAMGTHHLVAAAEARVRAAVRLAGTADDPAVRSAAGRVVQAAGRPLVDGRVLGALPLAAPILDFTASVSHGESLPRAFAGALGGAIGADLGSRAGLAACGGEAAATQGAGLIVCPTLTVVGGALGAQAGRTAALHVYDELVGPPDEHAQAAEARRGSRPGPGPGG
jgi:uncharacterized protein YukE